MHSYLGQCQCGAVTCSIKLPEVISGYSPRRCDCDFCFAKNILYLSEPKGNLTVSTDKPLERLQQGSEQAVFLQCVDFKDVITVSYSFASGLRGALNANLLSDSNSFKPAEVVSPKQLAPEDNVKHWKEFWMPLEILTNK